MPTCPICRAITSDSCSMGGSGTGHLPEWLKKYDEENYIIIASEDTVKSQIVHSFFIERRYILCGICKLLRDVVKYYPERIRKVSEYDRTDRLAQA